MNDAFAASARLLWQHRQSGTTLDALPAAGFATLEVAAACLGARFPTGEEIGRAHV